MDRYFESVCSNCKKNPIPDNGDCCISRRFKEYPLLKMAIKYAADKHTGQKRKNSKLEDYIIHPVEVMLLLFNHGVTDETTLIAAVLHDTLMYTNATLEEITVLFNPSVAGVVDEMTYDPILPEKETKWLQMEYVSRKSLPARLIELSDKISNSMNMLANPPIGWSYQKLWGYIAWSAEVCRRAISAGGIPYFLEKYVLVHFQILKANDYWLESYFKNMGALNAMNKKLMGNVP